MLHLEVNGACYDEIDNHYSCIFVSFLSKYGKQAFEQKHELQSSFRTAHKGGH